MRLGDPSRLFLSVCAYVASLGVIVFGGALAAHALLSAAPVPGFLEAQEPATIEPAPRPQLPAVQIKPYKPVATSSKSWTPSVRHGYVVRTPKATEVGEKPSKTKQKSRRASRKLSKQASDAYASGRSWPRGGF